MADFVTVDVTAAKKQVAKLRSRFTSLQRRIVVEALMEAGKPAAQAAQANAPRRSGLLASRIAVRRLRRAPGTFATVGVTATFQASKSKARNLATRLSGGAVPDDPFYGLFLAKGWMLTGHTPKPITEFVAKHGRRAFGDLKIGTIKGSRKAIRFISIKWPLKASAEGTIPEMHRIFAARFFQGMSELQSAGESAGTV